MYLGGSPPRSKTDIHPARELKWNMPRCANNVPIEPAMFPLKDMTVSLAAKLPNIGSIVRPIS